MRNAANDARYWQDAAKDANGNLLTGAGRTVTWNSFNMVSQVTQGANTLTYNYDADHTRIKETGPGGTTIYLNPRIDLGSHFEKTTKPNGTIEYKHYLYAGGQSIGVYTTRSTGVNDTRYFHADHLGSISVITGETGSVVARFSYDPFGNRATVSGDGTVTHHGFTGHEHMEEVGLVNMNGRVYDPSLARFMSADPNIQAPGNGQSFNRYSYVFNNPLSATDPSGYLRILGHEIRAFNNPTVRMVATIVIAAYTGTYAGLMSGSEMVAGAVGGFTGGFVGSGGNLKAGLIGGITGGAMAGVGGTWDAGTFENVAGHAAVGCASSSMSGGSCGAGALAGGFSGATNPYINDQWGAIGGAMASAVVGGTASVLGGGKFANGAQTGAFVYLFNHVAHNGFTLRNPNVLRNLNALNQELVNMGYDDNEFELSVTGGDRYRDSEGSIRSATNNSLVGTASQRSPHLYERGARAVDLDVQGVSRADFNTALRNTEFDPSSTGRDYPNAPHTHINLYNRTNLYFPPSDRVR